MNRKFTDNRAEWINQSAFLIFQIYNVMNYDRIDEMRYIKINYIYFWKVKQVDPLVGNLSLFKLSSISRSTKNSAVSSQKSTEETKVNRPLLTCGNVVCANVHTTDFASFGDYLYDVNVDVTVRYCLVFIFIFRITSYIEFSYVRSRLTLLTPSRNWAHNMLR